jgi:hypothetical protein
MLMAVIGVIAMVDKNIPVVLASMPGDYRTVNNVKKVDNGNNEYHLFVTKLWKGGIDYLNDHGFKIQGVDQSGFDSEVRIWVQKQK